MPTLSDCVSTKIRWELAVQTTAPAALARAFAAEAAAFYDRAEFDTLARKAREFYALHDPERAGIFRARLDRRLRDRHHTPVIWDLSSSPPR